MVNRSDINLNRQDVVLEEVAKAPVLMEARHQPELNLKQMMMTTLMMMMMMMVIVIMMSIIIIIMIMIMIIL